MATKLRWIQRTVKERAWVSQRPGALGSPGNWVTRDRVDIILQESSTGSWQDIPVVIAGSPEDVAPPQENPNGTP